MTMTINVRIDHLNSGTMNGQARHDARAPGHVPDYVDKKRIKNNSVLIRPPDSAKLAKEMAKHRKTAKPKQQALRKDARIAISGIITFGDEANVLIGNMSPEEQDKIFMESAKKISEHVDRDLIGLVVHRDETNPHAHFILRGYKYDAETGQEMPTRLSRADTSEIQDIGAIPVAYLGITRGTPKAERIAAGEDREDHEHISVKGMHARAAADKAKIAALEAHIKKLESRAELAYDNQEAAEERLKQQEKEIKENDEKIKKGHIEIDLIKNLKAKEKEDFEKYQRYITNTKENDKLDEDRRKKRIETYERRMQNAIDNFARLHEASPDKIREALENAAIIEPQVIFAGAENEEPELSVQVNHDLDWD